MYGMINQAIKDMVLTQFSEAHWISICKEAKSNDLDFVALQYYPDSITYDLVGAASSILGIPSEVILGEFGKFWVLYTAKEGYGPIMDLFGSNFKDCLMNLNNLHARMGMTMPQLTPPRFTFKENDLKNYEVEYFSTRPGLSPMVQGLLEGLAVRHGVKVKIDFFEGLNGEGSKTFKISILE